MRVSFVFQCGFQLNLSLGHCAYICFQEAIAGKCNILCISKDSRNPQPSAEEIQMADYVFYRTFDVGSCTISDHFGETVGGLDGMLLDIGSGILHSAVFSYYRQFSNHVF